MLYFVSAFFFPCAAMTAQEPYEGVAQVLGLRSAVTIPRIKHLTMQVGDQIPLFQQNEKYFIGVVRDGDGEKRLAAFKRVDLQNRASAWVTAQKELIFAREVDAVKGKVYLRKGENLPVVTLGSKNIRVEMTRYNQTVELDVPARLKGLYIREATELNEKLAQSVPKKPTVRRIQLQDVRPSSPVPTESASRSASIRIALTPSSPEGVESALSDQEGSLQKLCDSIVYFVNKAIEHDAADSSSDVKIAGADAAGPVYFQPDQAYNPEQQMSTGNTAVRYFLEELRRTTVISMLFLLITVLIAVGYARYQQKEMRKIAALIQSAPPRHQEPIPREVDSTVPVASRNHSKEESPTFNGSFDAFDVLDLMKFLQTSNSTGLLNVQGGGVSDPGRLIVEEGEFVQAVFDGATGEDAFLKLCSVTSGSFRFVKRDEVKYKRNIEKDSAVLLERTIDIIDRQNMKKIIPIYRVG